jgi:hypothetical protein
MSANNARLTAGQARDYRDLLEHLSALVLQFVRRGDMLGVRRWASSLAHVGNVLLDDAEHGGTNRRKSAADPEVVEISRVERTAASYGPS